MKPSKKLINIALQNLADYLNTFRITPNEQPLTLKEWEFTVYKATLLDTDCYRLLVINAADPEISFTYVAWFNDDDEIVKAVHEVDTMFDDTKPHHNNIGPQEID